MLRLVIKSSDMRADDALMLVRVWLHWLGADEDALMIDAALERFEQPVRWMAKPDAPFADTTTPELHALANRPEKNAA
jgi:hypothetical protein